MNDVNCEREEILDVIAQAPYYRMMATLYRMSADVLVEHHAAKGDQCEGNIRAVPFYFLMCHSFELLLKCALLKRGVNEKKLKSIEVRHDLRGLVQLLAKHGKELSGSTTSTIDILSEQHKRHIFRYDALSDGAFTLPAGDLFECYDELLMAGRLSSG